MKTKAKFNVRRRTKSTKTCDHRLRGDMSHLSFACSKPNGHKGRCGYPREVPHDYWWPSFKAYWKALERDRAAVCEMLKAGRVKSR